MFRAKLLKALAIGLCMSVLYTGAAYAQSGEGSSPSFEAQPYTTMAVDPLVAPDEVLTDNGDVPVSDKGELYSNMAVEPRAADGAEGAADGKVYKGSDAVATDDAEDTVLENPDVIFYTTADGVAEPGQEAELVYATGESADMVKSGVSDDSNDSNKGLSTPLTILLIAGGAMVIGGGAVAINKKRIMK